MFSLAIVQSPVDEICDKGDWMFLCIRLGSERIKQMWNDFNATPTYCLGNIPRPARLLPAGFRKILLLDAEGAGLI